MSDEPTPELRALAATLFAAGRAERPGPALGRRLSLIEPSSAALPAPARQRQSAAPRLRASRAHSALPLWLAAAALLAGGAGLWLSGDREAPIRISPERESRGVSTTPRKQAEAAEQVLKREAAAEATTAERPALDDGPERRASPSPPRPPPRRALAEPVVDAPRSAAPPAAAPQRAETPTTTTPAAASPRAQPLTLSAELDLLKRARAALRSGAGEQALGLLDQHSHERGGNGLDAEATLLRIEALSALGRQDEASQLATRFVAANPNNALGDRARSFIRRAQPGTP